MKVLIIYDLIPEETIKAIVEMTEDEYTMFSVANNTIVNSFDISGEQHQINMLISSALCNEPEDLQYEETGLGKEYFGKWSDNRNENIIDLTGVDRLIHAGFYL